MYRGITADYGIILCCILHLTNTAITDKLKGDKMSKKLLWGGRRNIRVMDKQEKYKKIKEQDVAELRKKRLQMWKKRAQKERFLAHIILFGGMVLIVGSFAIGITTLVHHFLKPNAIEAEVTDSSGDWIGQGLNISNKKVTEQPDIDVQLLTPNEYSRPQLATEEIKNIVVHYTANPGTTAQQNRDYFESLAQTHATSVSSHFVIGLEGEIIQCVPTAERAYASNHRNIDTVSIECCHPDESGRFTEETYDSLVELCAWLCGKFDLQPMDIIRHYDVTGKECPKYYVEHEDKWDAFQIDVMKYISKNGTTEDE